MTCGEVERLLAEGAPLTADARAHLEGCEECRASARRWAALRGELRAMRDEPLPPFLHARVMAHVRSNAEAPPPWWRRVPRAAWASAVVAALVVAILSTHGLWRLTQPDAALSPAAERALHEAAGARGANQAPAIAQPSEEGRASKPRAQARATGESAPVAAAEKKREAAAAEARPATAPRLLGTVADAVKEQPPAPVAAPRKEAWAPVEEQEAVPPQTPEHKETAGYAASAGVGAPGTRATAASEMAHAKGVAGPAPQVVVELAAEGGAAPLRVTLPAGLAPLSGEVWRVSVTDAGSVTVLDAQGRERADSVAALLQAMRLGPGRYELRRPPH